MNNFEHLSPAKLRQRKRLTVVALYVVWFGAFIAILASLYRLTVDGFFLTQTFFTAILAMGASIPVLQERNKINQVLATKSKR